MSLEDKVAALTTAIVELTAAVQGAYANRQNQPAQTTAIAAGGTYGTPPAAETPAQPTPEVTKLKRGPGRPKKILVPQQDPQPSTPSLDAEDDDSEQSLTVDDTPEPPSDKIEAHEPQPGTPDPAPNPAAANGATTLSPEEAYAPVRDLILKLSAEKGRSIALQVLATFGVAGGRELKPEQYPLATKALMSALATDLA